MIAKASVNVPILPIYIVRIIIDLPIVVRLEVIPVESPTVPNADISSNNNPRKFFSGSKMERAKVEIKISDIENKAIEKARLIVSFETVCLAISTFLRPLIVL